MRGVGEVGSSPVKAPVAIFTLPLFLLVVGIGDGVRYGSARAHPYQDSTAAAAGPVFVAPVGNQTAAIGREAIFSCSVGNIGKYKVGWLRASDQTILSMHTRTVTHNARIAVTFESGGSPGGSNGVGTTGNAGRGITSNQHGSVTGSSHVPEDAVNGTWQLHIRQLKESDRGCYMCQINTSPMISALGCLDILVPPDIVYGGETSTDVAVAEGDNATLTCQATGRPTPKVSWRREHGSILIRNSTSSTSGNSFGEYQNYTGSLLHFYRVDRRQMGVYMCIASNDVPPAVSKRVTLAVNFPPAVKASNQLLGTPLGTNVTLRCSVEAYPKTINYWMRNGKDMLLDGPKYSVSEVVSGYQTVMSLLIKHLSKEDFAGYKCVATNSLGKADGVVRLYELDLDNSARISRGKDHVSMIGGLAEAARGKAGSSIRVFENSSRVGITYALGAILVLLRTLCPR
ncbi:lachesin-like [Venturia canescens]|uniref:lachesin-like n=1 Tax=Venturia canescens TaxID=32260 RepID=UPI001C9D2495|nr:lachesin-like [Venturia canescens]